MARLDWSSPLPALAACATWLVLSACSPATQGLGVADDESGTATSEAGTEETAGDEAGDAEAGSSGTTDTSDTTDADTTGGTCGDGVIDPGEACDGADLGGSDCLEQGFAGGELACAGDCTLDTSGCVDQLCGNGAIEGDEACDGAELGGATCTDLGLGAGSLTCTGECTLDTSGCGPEGEGQQCWGFDCPEGLYCADGNCYDGSQGDPCNGDWNCMDGLSCQGWDGTCEP